MSLSRMSGVHTQKSLDRIRASRPDMGAGLPAVAGSSLVVVAKVKGAAGAVVFGVVEL